MAAYSLPYYRTLIQGPAPSYGAGVDTTALDDLIAAQQAAGTSGWTSAYNTLINLPQWAYSSMSP